MYTHTYVYTYYIYIYICNIYIYIYIIYIYIYMCDSLHGTTNKGYNFVHKQGITVTMFTNQGYSVHTQGITITKQGITTVIH